MKAVNKIKAMQARLQSRGIYLELPTIEILRRAEQRLHRWCEQECGDSDNFKSWCIVRDDTTGKPFRETVFHQGSSKHHLEPIRDIEASALKRIERICQETGLNYYYQTDPRGCALYVSKEPMTDSNYSSIGYAVCD